MRIQPSTGGSFLFTGDISPKIDPGKVGFAVHQRKWAMVSLESSIQITHVSITDLIIGLNLEVDYIKGVKPIPEPLDSDAMAREFLMTFGNTVMTVDQEVLFRYMHKGTQKLVLSVTIKGIDVTKPGSNTTAKGSYGVLSPNATVVFDKKPESQISLIGKSKGKTTARALINPDWDFQKIGIGGLDKEFSDIFRRAFASRVFPPEYSEQLGLFFKTRKTFNFLI